MLSNNIHPPCIRKSFAFSGVVEFDPLIISIMAILLTCIVAHEMWATYRKPLLANHDQVGREIFRELMQVS